MCECPLLHGRLRLGLNGSRPVSKPKLVGRYDNGLDCSHRLPALLPKHSDEVEADIVESTGQVAFMWDATASGCSMRRAIRGSIVILVQGKTPQCCSILHECCVHGDKQIGTVRPLE